MTFGKYNNYKTIIHRLDSRIKLIALISFFVILFLPYGTGYMNLVFYGIALILLFILSIISKASFISLFRSLKGIWVMVLFLLIISLLFANSASGDIAFSIYELDIYYSTIINVSFVLLRLIAILTASNIFSSTTKPMDMTYALEWFFYPLKLIKIPIHKFAMAISLALRFVPTITIECQRVIKAQASRGVDYNQGRLKEKFKALTSMIIPLFISSFMKSGELADAMEARGYDPDSKRTRYKVYHFGLKDVIAILILAIILAFFITACCFKFDLFSYLGVDLPKLS